MSKQSEPRASSDDSAELDAGWDAALESPELASVEQAEAPAARIRLDSLPPPPSVAEPELDLVDSGWDLPPVPAGPTPERRAARLPSTKKARRARAREER